MPPSPVTALTHAQARVIADCLHANLDFGRNVVVAQRNILSKALQSLPTKSLHIPTHEVMTSEALMMCSAPSQGGDIDLLVMVDPQTHAEKAGENPPLWRLLSATADTFLISPGLPHPKGLPSISALDLWRRGIGLSIRETMALRAQLSRAEIPHWFREQLAVYRRLDSSVKAMNGHLRACSRLKGTTSLHGMVLLMCGAHGVGPGECIVELGAFEGRSTSALTLAAHHHPIYTIDHHQGDQDLAQLLEQNLSDLESYSALKENLEALQIENDVVPICQDSLVAVANWAGLPIGLIYFDVHYDYRDLKADFEAWHGRLAPGALIFFGGGHNPGVQRVVKEAQGAGQLEGVMISEDLVLAKNMGLPAHGRR